MEQNTFLKYTNTNKYWFIFDFQFKPIHVNIGLVLRWNEMKNFYETKLKEKFQSRYSFSRDELFDFFLQFEPDLKPGTFGWRIHDLKQSDLLKFIGKGIYTLAEKAEHTPQLGKTAKKVVKLVTNGFSDFDYCLWETSWLNEFTNLQSVSSIIILEIEKELLASAFNYLQNTGINDLFLQPSGQEMERYIVKKENPVVLKSLISRSPVQKLFADKHTVSVPFLEKILVDLYCGTETFYFYQGSQLKHIFETALERYTIDFSRLLTYAKRRGKGSEIKKFIETEINYSIPLNN